MAIELAGCMGVCLWPMFVYSMRDGYIVGWLHGGYICGLCLCTVSEKAVELAGCMGERLWPMFVYSIREGCRVGWLHGGYVCGLCVCTV